MRYALLLLLTLSRKARAQTVFFNAYTLALIYLASCSVGWDRLFDREDEVVALCLNEELRSGCIDGDEFPSTAEVLLPCENKEITGYLAASTRFSYSRFSDSAASMRSWSRGRSSGLRALWPSGFEFTPYLFHIMNLRRPFLKLLDRRLLRSRVCTDTVLDCN